MPTGTSARFPAALDLGERLPLFARDEAAVASRFQDYRATNMRLFAIPALRSPRSTGAPSPED